MTNDAKPNYSINFEYMLRMLGITYTKPSYTPGKTIPRLDLAFSTIKIVRSGKGPVTKSGKVVSDKVLQKIVDAFSLLLTHPEERRITVRDLDLDPKEFSKLFPQSAFIQDIKSHLSVNMTVFTNKLYRCYYMMPNSPHKAFMAYFKLIEKDGQYEAWLVRGIRDFSLANDIRNLFETPEELEQCINQKEGGKEAESMHLYKAWNDVSRGHRREDISFTKNCIKIDFHSVEDEPCHATMYWNICIPVGMQLTSYIGGSALMVDTNDGKRGKNICSFKMGLEAIEDIPTSQRMIVEQGPIVSDAPQLIQELVLDSNHGIMALDNSDDNRWYRFIQGDSYRKEKYDRYADVDVDALITSLVKLKTDYQHELSELRKLVKSINREDLLLIQTTKRDDHDR